MVCILSVCVLDCLFWVVSCVVWLAVGCLILWIVVGCLLACCVFLIRLFVVALGFRFNHWICFWTGVFLRVGCVDDVGGCVVGAFIVMWLQGGSWLLRGFECLLLCFVVCLALVVACCLVCGLVSYWLLRVVCLLLAL